MEGEREREREREREVIDYVSFMNKGREEGLVALSVLYAV